jgi:hypothetical protein
MPTWASDLRRLAAMIDFSAFITNIILDKLTLNRAIEMEEDLKNVHA